MTSAPSAFHAKIKMASNGATIRAPLKWNLPVGILTIRRRLGGVAETEVHFRRFFRTRSRLEICLRLKVPETGHEAAGELLNISIVIAGRIIEAAALDRNPIFRSFELRLQIHEVLIRFEFRIPLHNHEQSRQR